MTSSLTRLDQDPRGYYSAEDVALVVGVRDETVRSWTRSKLIQPSQRRAPVAAYAFQDVTEALIVRELLRRGVDRADVRAARSILGDRYGNWPFISAELYTETVAPKPRRRDVLPDQTRMTAQRVVVVVREKDIYWEISRRAPVQSFNQDGREPLEDMVEILRRGGWPSKKADLQLIEIDPDRMSGRPTIRGQRLEVEFVAGLASTEAGRAELVDDFELSDEEIDEALKWWEIAEASTLVGV